MPLEDGFWAALDDQLSRLTLRELLTSVFPSPASTRGPLPLLLDTRANPDLPDMYAELVDIFSRERLGHCAIDLHLNDGAQPSGSEVVESLLRRDVRPYELDLVLEQRFTAVDYAARRGGFPTAVSALEWMASRALLYFLVERGRELHIEPSDAAGAALLPAAEALSAEGCVVANNERGLFEATDRGREESLRMTAEAVSALEDYEAFADVVFDAETGESQFGTGQGVDLRIPVYEAEGLDAARVILFVELHDGTIARMEADWRESIMQRDFFEAMLLPVVDRPLVDAESLRAIIDAGFDHRASLSARLRRETEDARLRRALKDAP